jgi:hypothetical protein
MDGSSVSTYVDRMAASSFDPIRVTEALQEAVRTHDASGLDALVSERMSFTSGRAVARMGKREWIDAAMKIPWRTFHILDVRLTLITPEVVVVEHSLEQEIDAEASAPVEFKTDPVDGVHSAWVTTDVWADEGGVWRLVHRHPERLG